MQKNINLEVKRDLKPFEKDYLKSIYCENKEVLKIYHSKKSNWNLILINCEVPYFVSIPKIKNSCSPSIYGRLEHAQKYNTFINLD